MLSSQKLRLYSVISQVAKARIGQKYWESEVYKRLQAVIYWLTTGSNKRPQYHSQKTFVSFKFEIQLHYTMINGNRWKTIA
ncbi:MAG: hypothetical protein DRP45_04750 [Candidatus Zixiibacteriota bacterium]|nr:MAG: hypothetical protein DRP45_04750 [candidate division Zixibacteria bacterium]